ncbi:MAG: DNA starvation/stationary phase protection protein [Chitinophagaceae bacterium]
MKPHTGITAANLAGLSKLLTTVLADAMVLYTKTRKFHWNVSGNSFMELHLLFESQYKELEESIDEIAERISKLGFPAPGTLKEFLEHTSLKESPGKNPGQKAMLAELLKDHESVIIRLRKYIEESDEKYKDKSVSDFFTSLLESHETMAWKLRRYLS